jgi:hypothetical protein
MYYAPETLLNHVFEDVRKPKAPNKQIHFYIGREHSSAELLRINRDIILSIESIEGNLFLREA